MIRAALCSALALCLLCSCAAPAAETSEPTPTAAVTPAPEPAPAPTPEPAPPSPAPEELPVGISFPGGDWHTLEIQGIPLGSPLDSLPEELIASLTQVGEPEDPEGYGDGLWTTYTAPGLELVTSKATDRFVDQLIEAVEEPAPQVKEELVAQYQAERGREYVSILRLTGEDYPTVKGLKVGDSRETCRELGYLPQGEGEEGDWLRITYALQSFDLYFENDVLTEIVSDRSTRFIGSFYW